LEDEPREDPAFAVLPIESQNEKNVEKNSGQQNAD
jgi:hypothetical protein